MTSNTIQYGNSNNSNLENRALQQPGWFTNMIKRLDRLLVRAQVESAQARFKLRYKHQQQAESRQDMVRSLPLEEKLRLGMYHFMD
ncbi:MAG: hypothetical protein JSU67_11720 [Gammaproteobacteria bacterium]|nr:MAG: hypothetical protein JSU67_11720 [Gammaproteobacteria bacterium]